MATYAIGDVQGCYDALHRLLDAVHFDNGKDVLWFAGDLINRGPQSAETLRFVRSLGHHAITVLGNHDLTLLGIAAGTQQAKAKDTFDHVLNATDAAELITWLRQQPLLHHDAELGFTMVHAGLHPHWDLALAQNCAKELEKTLRGADHRLFLANMFGNQPNQWRNELKGIERLRCITNIFTRLRFCTDQGVMSFKEKGPPGSQAAHLLPWFQIADRKNADLNIIFGHWAALGHYHQAGIYALDSGCVWGGQLTAMRLDGEQRGQTYSVACHVR